MTKCFHPPTSPSLEKTNKQTKPKTFSPFIKHSVQGGPIPLFLSTKTTSILVNKLPDLKS